MSAVNKKQFGLLIDLQKTEQKSRAIQAILDRLPDELASLERRLEEFKQAVENESIRLAELHTTYRAHESDASDYQAQIKKSEEKLKAVKTNKEYQSGLKEIEEIKRLYSNLEDQMIACLEDIDSAEKEIANQNRILEKMITEVNTDKKNMEHDSELQSQELKQLQNEHQLLLENVDADLLAKYTSVQAIIGEIALAGVKDAVCQVCNVNLPPQMYNELLRADKLFYCPHCQRIIYPVKAFTEQ